MPAAPRPSVASMADLSRCWHNSRVSDADLAGRDVVLLLNVGSPAQPTEAAVASYLRDFLGDELVVSGMPGWFRGWLVNRVIVPRRTELATNKYRYLWHVCGQNPLLANCTGLARALAERLQRPVLPAMRYGSPGAGELPGSLSHANSITLLPLFAHHTYSSRETALRHYRARLTWRYPGPQLRVLRPYYNQPAFITALAGQARAALDDETLLVVSFHSIPNTHQRRGRRAGFDYVDQCRSTAKLLTAELGRDDTNTVVTFQSAMGRDWVGPLIEDEVAGWPRRGWRRVAVLNPGFAVDCLETVYDIGCRLREYFMAAGGVELVRIDCLNTSRAAIDLFTQLLDTDLVGPVAGRG